MIFIYFIFVYRCWIEYSCDGRTFLKETKYLLGADRWISNLRWRLTHIRTKIKFLENNDIPNGALLRMPDEYDPSPVKLSLLEKGMDVDIQKEETAKLDDDLYRLMEF